MNKLRYVRFATTPLMMVHREINWHWRKLELKSEKKEQCMLIDECEREKNRHINASGKAISVIRTDEK